MKNNFNFDKPLKGVYPMHNNQTRSCVKELLRYLENQAQENQKTVWSSIAIDYTLESQIMKDSL